MRIFRIELAQKLRKVKGKFGQFPQLSRQLLLRLLIENAPGGKYAFPFEKVRNRLIWKTGMVIVCPQPKYKFLVLNSI